MRHNRMIGKRNQLTSAAIVLAAVLVGAMGGGPAYSEGLTAEVRQVDGSALLFVNGQPRAPLMFFGWAFGPRTTPVDLTPEWREYHVSFIAPEDNEGNCGVHIRFGNAPGAVWIDDAAFYEGQYRPDPGPNLLRCGDWECDRQTADQAWTLFVKSEVGAKASWQFDSEERRAGKQSCKVTVEQPGQETWHVHLYQTGLTVKKGQWYTLSVWLKADRNRQGGPAPAGDMQVLHHGPPWRIYSGKEGSVTSSQIRLAAAAGVHIHSIGLGMPWPRPGELPDFTEVDEIVSEVLTADPQSLILPRFGVEPPAWWSEQYPEDVEYFDNGRGTEACVSSSRWRTEAAENVRRFVEHCEQEYGAHMIGYHPCAQHTGEWFYPRTWEPHHSGLGPATQRGFVEWLKRKYGAEEALQKAWAQTGAKFETVSVPSVQERSSAALGLFRDPAREQRIVDFHEYRQTAMVEPIELLASAIKQQTNRRKLVVAFYGYFFEISQLPHGPQASGHLALARLLECPDVDIVCSPISYDDRGLGGIGAFMAPVDSVRGHGKLWLNEDDTRTYLTPPDAGYGRVETPQHTEWVHERNFGQIFPRRLACWYMDLGGTGWLDAKGIWDAIAPLRQFYDAHLAEPACWAPDVAVIVDETGPLYLASNATVMGPLAGTMRHSLYRMGAPFGIYLLSDLVAGRVPPARAYLFLACFHLTPEQRTAIADQVRGKTAVWLYGSGFLSDRAGADKMGALMGMPVREVPGIPNAMVTVAQGASPLTAGLDGTRFGTESPLAPLWAVEETPGLEVVGRFEGGAVAAASLEGPGGRAIYIGTVAAPAGLLRNILKAAGVHVYIETNDVLLTDGRFLTISASEAGHKVIRFGSPRRVLRLPGGEEIVAATDAIEMDLALGETRLFWLEKAK